MPIGLDTAYRRRDLPHLEKNGKTYFLTFCTYRAMNPLSNRTTTSSSTCCIHDHRKLHFLHAAVVMPDHVHLLLIPTTTHC